MAASQREAIEAEDREQTFSFSDESAAGAAAEGAEGVDNSPAAILARQRAEAEAAEGEAEDRGDDFQPTTEEGTEGEAGEFSAEDLAAAAEALGIEEQKPEQTKPIFIPKARFDEVNARMKAAELKAEDANRKLQEALQGKTAQPAEPYDFDAAELRYMETLTEGDHEKALEIRREIRAQEQAAFTAMNSGAYTEQAAQADLNTAFEEVLDGALDLYPFLDSNSEGMNQTAIDLVLAERFRLEQTGKNSAVALAQAVAKVAPLFASLDTTTSAAPEKTPAQLRAEEALRRNAQASVQQPSNLGRAGEQAGARSTYNVAAMSEDDFNALPEAEKRKLRGDDV